MPDNATMHRYLHDSDLARYRQTQDYQDTFTQLRQELWAGQIEWVEGRVRRYLGMEKYVVQDWGPRMRGWTEIVSTNNSFISEYVIADPLPPVAPQGRAENGHVAILFDVIQRCTRPAELLKKVHKSLVPGGLLLLSSRSGSGFDVLTLAGESDSIYPLDHICLPSPQGINLLLQRAGFDILELTTPGLLDAQLVQRAADRIPTHQYFQRYLSSLNDDLVFERLQAFLQQNNLSSHLRVVAVKRGEA
ncbi:hypothetical protein JCM31598_25690 [Desulfonatronum parangueonense]